MNSPITIPEKHLSTYQLYGIKGRIFKKTSQKTNNFLILGGQHTSLERMYAIADFVSDYGSVEMIDLPGFGGMQSFESVGIEISLESYADFLFDYLKTSKKKYKIFATSFSSMVATRMLQKYPEAKKYVSKNIMFVGLSSKNNFNLSPIKMFSVKMLITLFSGKFSSKIFDLVVVNRFSLRVMLGIFSLIKPKMKATNAKIRADNIAMEYCLWKINDRRTHAISTKIMMNTDLTKFRLNLDVPAHNILAKNDQYFDNESVNHGFNKIFKNYNYSYIKLSVHAPSVLASKLDVAKIMSKDTISALDN